MTHNGNGQLPPNDPVAERGLLGCVLLDGAIVMPEIRRTPPEAFYDERHRVIFEAQCSLYDDQKPCDEVSVGSALRRMGRLDEIGGHGYIAELPNCAPSAHNWPTHFEDLERSLTLRRLVRIGSDFSARAMASPDDVPALLADFESQSLAIRQLSTPRGELVDWKSMRNRTLEEYQQAMSQTGRTGLKTGLVDLDGVIGGLRAQELVLIAGSPSSGKTSLALNIAVNAALQQRIKTGVVSLETSGFKVVHRLNCIASGASGSRLLNGKPLEQDMTKLTAASSDLVRIGEHVLIYDGGAASVGECVAMLRRLYAKGCRLFIVDYLQLLDANQKTSNGNERMTLVSKAIKSAAKELDCPIIGISSLNRQSARENRAPSRHDLRETGQLEFDADVIILLHSNTQDSEARAVEVNVDKNKDGNTGKLDLTFFPFCMQFRTAPRISEEDVPESQYRKTTND